ncbi:HAD-IIB family hydrolase [Candidatus Uhrbacteria bacterium]|nr:HAD-IIB family hydrolase [Candidatus Uhrbacteria bacterium]
MQARQDADLIKQTLIVFDLDGTLTETKSPMDKEMSGLLKALLKKKIVAVIGGGKYDVFKSQFIGHLRAPTKLLGNLFLFPTTATAFYRYASGWKKVYELKLTKREKQAIRKAFQEAFREVGYVHPKKVYGSVIEDRGTQVTFSALGQEIVASLGQRGVELKKQWLAGNKKIKMKLARALQRRLPNLEVRAAGYTSIDVTKKGIDKAYGIRQIEKHLHVPKRQMLFIGDALFPGGNDFAVRRTGVKCIAVSGPKQTKQFIRSWLGVL